MKNSNYIKELGFFLALFFYCLPSYGTATICEDAMQMNCIRYAKVQFGINGEWYNACCYHFELMDHQNCSDDCDEPPALTKTTSNDEHYDYINAGEGMKWTAYLDDGSPIHNNIQFIGKYIYLNGQVVAKFKEEVTQVILQLPGTMEEEKVWIKLKSHSMQQFSSQTIDAGVIAKAVFGEDEIKSFKEKFELDRASRILVFPNPAKAGQEIEIVSSINLISVTLLNANGIQLKNINSNSYGKINSKQLTFSLPSDLIPGIYFIKLKFSGSEEVKRIMIDR